MSSASPPPRHRRRRTHRGRKVRSGRFPGPTARRGGRQRRLHAALPGMDIGTAKLTPEERGGVPHHLLDVWDVTEAASVAEYQRMARERIDALLAAGRWPVLVGGSGLYVRGAVDNLEFPAPTRRSGPGWKRNSRCAARERCTPGSPRPTPTPAGRSCRATAAASSARSRSSRSPVVPSPPTSPATTRSTTPCRSASTWPAPNWTSASPAGSTGCGRRVSSKKCAHSRRRGCARGVRRRAPSATSRCSPPWPGSAPWKRHGPRPSVPPSASRAVRIHGSGAIPGCTG